jgi:hypothetical protein
MSILNYEINSKAGSSTLISMLKTKLKQGGILSNQKSWHLTSRVITYSTIKLPWNYNALVSTTLSKFNHILSGNTCPCKNTKILQAVFQTHSFEIPQKIKLKDICSCVCLLRRVPPIAI